MKRKLVRQCLAGIAMLAGGLGCGVAPHDSGPEEVQSSTPAEDTGEAVAPLAAPPAVRGLMTRDGVPASGWGFIDNAVVLLDWKQLEPVDLQDPTDTRWNFEALRTAVDRLKSVNGGAVSNVKVRILAGDAAPGFVKRAGHAPNYVNGTSEDTGTLIDCYKNGGPERGGVAVEIGPVGNTAKGCAPFFWTDGYLNQYADLMNALSQALDTDPVLNATVSTVINSACMSIYAEPFYRAQRWGQSNLRLYRAGLTYAADRRCHEQAILIHKAAFGTKRRTAMALNNWDIVDDTSAPDYRTVLWKGTTRYPVGAYEFIEWAQQQLTLNGTRMLELQNNGLGDNATEQCQVSPPNPQANYWCYLAAYPGRKGFQTETWAKLGGPDGLYTAIENGLSMGAKFIELPAGYTQANPTVLACYDQRLQQGTTTSCRP